MRIAREKTHSTFQRIKLFIYLIRDFGERGEKVSCSYLALAQLININIRYSDFTRATRGALLQEITDFYQERLNITYGNLTQRTPVIA